MPEYLPNATWMCDYAQKIVLFYPGNCRRTHVKGRKESRVCVWFCECVFTYVQVLIHVEARGLPQVWFLRSHKPCFFHVGFLT